MNGMALHGGLIPYGGTFLTFSDYSRNALRMAALMKIRSLFVFTHDSIGLGEDGPTHQSVEHAASLRLIPNMDVWRPCDSRGVGGGLDCRDRAPGRTQQPAVLAPEPAVSGAQSRPASRRSAAAVMCLRMPTSREAVIIATGSEVALAMDAKKILDGQGIAARVVSMPCTSVFDRQDAAYRDAVLPKGIKRVAVEAGVTDYWRKYVGLEGAVVGIDRFGESAPAGELFKFFGITVDAVVDGGQKRVSWNRRLSVACGRGFAMGGSVRVWSAISAAPTRASRWLPPVRCSRSDEQAMRCADFPSLEQAIRTLPCRITAIPRSARRRSMSPPASPAISSS